MAFDKKTVRASETVVRWDHDLDRPTDFFTAFLLHFIRVT